MQSGDCAIVDSTDDVQAREVMGRNSREQSKQTRNFYRDNYRISTKILVWVNLVTLVALVTGAYLFINRPPHIYYATTSIGILVPLRPLIDPNQWHMD